MGSFWRAWGLVAASCLAGCSSSPSNLFQITPTTTVKHVGPPLGAFGVQLTGDRRPPEEHGRRSYPGRTYLGGNDFLEPTSASLLRIICRDLEASGLATFAEVGRRDADYLVWVTIESLAASFNEGVETLVPVLPTSLVEGRCRLKWSVRDPAGRVFADSMLFGEKSNVEPAVAGLSRSAATKLGQAIRTALDPSLAELPESVSRFWAGFGRLPPNRR